MRMAAKIAENEPADPGETPTQEAQRGGSRHSRTRTASPRPLARMTRNENEDETKPISRFRGADKPV